PARDPYRRHAPGQGETRLHAACGHGRLRRRGERREDRRDGVEARHEDLLPPFRVSWRDQAADAPRAARTAPDGGPAQGGQGDAPQEQAGLGADHEAKDLRRAGASARSPVAEATGAPVSEIAQYLGTGKRKTSVARVILRPGDGKT